MASIRGLLCTATNKTPHEALFNFSRSSKFGVDLPSFLTKVGGTVLHRKRNIYKGDIPTEKATLIETISPHFSRVQFSDGRTSTVSTRDLARFPQPVDNIRESETEDTKSETESVRSQETSSIHTIPPEDSVKRNFSESHINSENDLPDQDTVMKTRSGRIVRRPTRFENYEID